MPSEPGSVSLWDWTKTGCQKSMQKTIFEGHGEEDGTEEEH